MKKIPIGRTIAEAYMFTFGQVGTVIGLIWLPLVAITLGQFFVIDYYTPHLLSSGDPTATGRALLVGFGFSLVSLLFTAIIGVSLTRQVMAPRKGAVIWHFALGPAEFSYFLSLLSIILVLIAVYIALVFTDLIAAAISGAVIQMSGAGAGAKAAGVGVAALLVAFNFAAFLFVGVRLVALVAPVTVSEGKMDLIRAWQLSRGNFWRLFLVLLGTLAPILIIDQLGFAAIVGPAYLVKFGQAILALFQAVAGDGAVPTQALAQIPDISQKAPLILGLDFLLAPLRYGLLFAAPALAFRALAGGTPMLPSEPDAGPFSPA